LLHYTQLAKYLTNDIHVSTRVEINSADDTFDHVAEEFGCLEASEGCPGERETVKEGFQMGVDHLKETFDMLKDSFWPMVDMVLDDESLIVYVEVPGYKIGDLKLDVKDNVITIKGERKMPEDLTMTSVNWYLHERSYGTFTRHIELPTNVQLDETKIQAWLNFGVLEIKIPRIGGKVTTMNVPISLADRVKQAVGVGSGKVEVEKKQ